MFEGIRGADYTSDLAIDDIQVFQNCPQPSRKSTDVLSSILSTRVNATAAVRLMSKIQPSGTKFAVRIPTNESSPVTIATSIVYTSRNKITIKHSGTRKTPRLQIKVSTKVSSTIFASQTSTAKNGRILPTT